MMMIQSTSYFIALEFKLPCQLASFQFNGDPDIDSLGRYLLGKIIMTGSTPIVVVVVYLNTGLYRTEGVKPSLTIKNVRFS